MYSRVLIDTSAIYALVSASDNFHHQASHLYQNLIDRGVELYTTSYILVETSALVHRRLGFLPLRSFIESTQDIFNIHWIDRLIHGEAWKEMKTKDGARLSLVDWTTIVVARRLNAVVFAFDEDFRQEAVDVLP